MLKYIDQTKMELPNKVGEACIVPLPNEGYSSKWYQWATTEIIKRGSRSNPKKKFKYEKHAAGIYVVRVL